jgi:prophage regulatory protein
MSDRVPLRVAAADPPALLVIDAKGLAAMLCVSVRTVRAWDAAGKLPRPVRIGGRVLWRLTEVHGWLDAGAPDREVWEAKLDSRDRA